MSSRHPHHFLPALLFTPLPGLREKGKNFFFNSASHLLLRTMAVLFNRRSSLNQYLKGIDGWIDFSIGFNTETEGVCQAAVFKNGKMSVLKHIPEDADAVLQFENETALVEMLRSTPNETLN